MDGNDRSWTLLELLNWTTDYFRRRGIEDARLNAEILLGEVTGLARVMLYARFDRRLDTEQRERFRSLVRRRGERCPLQYVLGRAEFYGRSLGVSPAVLIPRPETELVVDKCLEKLPGEGAGLWAVDVGTGSGAIGLTLACERELLRVAATDSSADALEVARRNARALGVEQRLEFAQGALCRPLPGRLRSGEERVEVVASNPPYVPTSRLEELQPEVRDHEPREALDGGPDGLEVIREVIPEAARTVAPGGWVVLELGEGQAEQVRQMAGRTEELDCGSTETIRDGAGCERVLALRRHEA